MAPSIAQLQRESSESTVDVAYELGQHLLRFKGCPLSAHQGADREHSAPARVPTSPHIGLAAYSDQLRDANVPTTLSQPSAITQAQREALAPPHWQSIFKGTGGGWTAGPAQDAPQVCLECSQADPVQPTTCFDVDSFLGFGSSLAVARHGLTVDLFPRFHRNISNDLHVYTTVYPDLNWPEKTRPVKLHHVPHYYLGRVLGGDEIAIYLFFPACTVQTRELS